MTKTAIAIARVSTERHAVVAFAAGAWYARQLWQKPSLFLYKVLTKSQPSIYNGAVAAAKIAARTSANARRSRFRRKSIGELESLRTKHLLILADIERVLSEKYSEAAIYTRVSSNSKPRVK